MPRKLRHRAASLAEFLTFTGLSKTDFAELLGISPSAVSRYVSGERTPRLHLAVRISKLTGVPVSHLIPDAKKAA